MRIAMLHTRVRVEERLLIEAFEARGAAVEPIDLRDVVLDPSSPGRFGGVDVVFDRSLSLTGSLTALRVLEGTGVRCVNPAEAVGVCGDKLRTTIALERAGVPTPRVRVATDATAALDAVEQLGYPAVIKPTVGSWGRLVARVNDRDAAEAVIEHRATLGSAEQGVFYVQEHVDKPGRDVRVFVVGGRAIAAIVRSSAHWVTNTARGATAAGLEVTPELAALCERAVASTGADIAAVDVLECPRRGLLVNEINHSMEFRNSISTTGVDIPGIMVEHVLGVAEAVRAGRGAPA